MLCRVVRLYREQHQGLLLSVPLRYSPVLPWAARASRVDYEDDARCYLVYVQMRHAFPSPEWSQGTRDQPFLSLRFAAIEQHTEGGSVASHC